MRKEKRANTTQRFSPTEITMLEEVAQANGMTRAAMIRALIRQAHERLQRRVEKR